MTTSAGSAAPQDGSAATPDGRVESRLDTAWERRTRRGSIVTGIVAALVAAALTAILFDPGPARTAAWVASAVVGLVAYRVASSKIRRRRRILSEPFPAEWEAVLHQDVLFFQALDEPARRRFRRELQTFLGEKRITGIRTDLDTTTLVLAGASAIIPIFGFPDWEWDEISEVLVYPDRFGRDYQFGDKRGEDILGMVGTGAMNRVMILSKPDLVQGFRNPVDKRNVGLHEFAHLVDKTDGAIDGLPGVGLDRQSIGPWVELVRRKMREIEDGDSDIDPYALTNESEFFAVATEYFFERPGIMERKHPELFAMMKRIFQQDFGGRLRKLAADFRPGRKRFGRNSPCPCGSGKKFKKCCLKRSRSRGTRRARR